jgi:hypothetical protein
MLNVKKDPFQNVLAKLQEDNKISFSKLSKAKNKFVNKF